MSGVTLVNFSHPITSAQQAEIAAALDRPLDRILDIPTQFDQGRPFVEQTIALLSQVDIDWETAPLLVNLPAYAPIAAIVLAQLHGLTGHFPAIMRLRPVDGAIPTCYELAEVVPLDRMREAARENRGRDRS